MNETDTYEWQIGNAHALEMAGLLSKVRWWRVWAITMTLLNMGYVAHVNLRWF